MEEDNGQNSNNNPGLAQLSQQQIEYLISTVHDYKPELDKLFEKTSSTDLFIILSYLSAVYFTHTKESQYLFENLVNTFMNVYPFYLELYLRENKNIPPGFRIIIPEMPPRKPEDEFIRAVVLEQSPTTGAVN